MIRDINNLINIIRTYYINKSVFGKQNKMSYTQLFIHRNKAVVIFSIISIILIIKLSNLPLILPNSKLIDILFTVPDNDISAEILGILENLSFAYISSVIFYMIVDYIPKQKSQNKAFQIAKDELDKIVCHLVYILEVLRFESQKIETLGIHNIGDLVNIKFDNKIYDCRIVVYKDEELYIVSDNETLHDIFSIKSSCEHINGLLNNIGNLSLHDKLSEELLVELGKLKNNKIFKDFVGLNPENITEGYTYKFLYGVEDLVYIQFTINLLVRFGCSTYKVEVSKSQNSGIIDKDNFIESITSEDLNKYTKIKNT